MTIGPPTTKSAGRRLTQAVALLFVFGVVFAANKLVPADEGPSGPITAVGLLLLGGLLSAELFEVFGLPHLTGYLLAGAIAGPHVLRLVERGTVETLEPANTLALSLIALAGGAELRISLLKQVFRSLVWGTVAQCAVGVVAVGAALLSVARFLPFTAELGLPALVGVALIWGVLGICRSPSATLGIFSEVRPSGPLSRFSLAFVMTSDIVVIVLLTVAMSIARPLIEPGTTVSLADFGDLGHEVLGSIALGTTLGLLLAAYMWLVGKQLLVLLIAIGFGLTEGLHYLRFDPLLAFMVAGFVVANMSKQGDKLLSAIERAGGVVYVVFFATAGARLDLSLVMKLWPVAVYLCAVRVLAVWGAHRLGSSIAKDEPVVRRWGWSSLVSQAGLVLGLLVVIDHVIPSLGPGFHALAIANVALNQVVGPVLLKFALDRTGESGRGKVERAFHDPAQLAGVTGAAAKLA